MNRIILAGVNMKYFIQVSIDPKKILLTLTWIDMGEMDFFSYKNRIKPEKGKLLISEPFLPDPNFERTVVLLCECNEDGAFGFVINKPSILKVDEVIEDIKNFEAEVFVGGPVQQDTLHFLHRCEQLGESKPIHDNINWGGSLDSLLFLTDTNQINSKDIRFFLGYSGWGPGQLESELEDESWIVCEIAAADLLFDTDPKLMWKKALGSMGGRFSVYANYPIDPRMN